MIAGFRSSQPQSDAFFNQEHKDDAPQTLSSAFADFGRGTSYRRENSENLKRRSNSYARHATSGHASGKASSLRTILSATSLGALFPTLAEVTEM